MSENHRPISERPDWLKLDNAAKIYPAAMSRNWTALFRVSAELTEPVDPVVLEQAQRAALRRMPSFAVCLRRGLFWYYLEKLDGAPAVPGGRGAEPGVDRRRQRSGSEPVPSLWVSGGRMDLRRPLQQN